MIGALDFSSLQKAIAQLDEAIAFSDSDLVAAHPRLALHLRAAAIQAFEFTYELSVKSLKRFLEATEANPSAVDEMSFSEMIRRGYELGLLQAEIAAWRAFRRDRGTTSHAYDEAKAAAVFQAIPAFATEAKFLLAQIKERQERSR
jgi:nucleotidyltransferase substrate binding protein (TIGR01987 family)